MANEKFPGQFVIRKWLIRLRWVDMLSMNDEGFNSRRMEEIFRLWVMRWWVIRVDLALFKLVSCHKHNKWCKFCTYFLTTYLNWCTTAPSFWTVSNHADHRASLSSGPIASHVNTSCMIYPPLIWWELNAALRLMQPYDGPYPMRFVNLLLMLS